MKLLRERMRVTIAVTGTRRISNFGDLWVTKLLRLEPKERRKNNLYLSVMFYEHENRP